MKYQGGKFAARHWIVDTLQSIDPDPVVLLEPFCGGCSVTTEAASRGYDAIIAADADPHLIAMWQAIQAGWLPPDSFSRAEYMALKADPDSDPIMAGFASRALSFGGKYWGGYGSKEPTPQLKSSLGSITKQQRILQDPDVEVVFAARDYREWEPEPGWLVYADPPYAGTTKNGKDSFDSDEFWDIMTRWSERCPVVVSEYAAPDGWVSLGSKVTRLTMSATTNGDTQLEQLWTRPKA